MIFISVYILCFYNTMYTFPFIKLYYLDSDSFCVTGSIVNPGTTFCDRRVKYRVSICIHRMALVIFSWFVF